MSVRSRHHWSRLLVVGLAFSLLAAACGDSERDDEGADDVTPEAEAEADAFPVTIEHAFGSTTVEEAPTNVATVGWSSADTAVALGTVPVAIPTDTFAGDDDGYLPWLREAVEADDADLPATYVDMPELDIDAVIEADPDLILAVYSGIDEATYDQLADIAPTVAYPDVPWITPWQEQTTMVATALGQPERGDEMVTEVEALLAEAAEEHPAFAGKTFAYVFAGEGGALSLYVEGDARVDILESLGFVVPDFVGDLEPSAGTFTANISIEEADILNEVDVLFTWFNNADEQAALEANPLFAQIPAVERGSYVPLLDPQVSLATSAVTVLSLPWALDTWLPTVDDAAANA